MITPHLLVALSLVAAAPAPLSALKWEKRILLVAAPDEQDASLKAQRRIMAAWTRAAEDRDLAMVEIVADKVTGASDPSAALRKRYDLPVDRFSVVLIGKDGGTKLRQTHPISATALENTIDAMPMRRAGGR